MLLELENKIVEVAEKVIPSVVSVATTVLRRIDLFRVAPVEGQGSGVVVSKDGIIVTNAHVIKDAQRVIVQLHNGEKFDAKVLGRMRGQDIAFLKIETKAELTPIAIGNCKGVKVGQFAIAVGNPLGLGSSVTFGMVSAKNRTIGGRSIQLENLIQTTAQINPGNSGGALVNTSGELIGIPTAVIPFSQGIGFAINVDSIKGVLDEFKKEDSDPVARPWLGILGYTLDVRVARHYNLPVDSGALIVQIAKGPAKAAGLRQGDIIVGFEDKNIQTIQKLNSEILQRKVGEEVTITIIRGSNKLQLKVKLGQSATR